MAAEQPVNSVELKSDSELNPAAIPNIAVKNRPLSNKVSVFQATYGDSETLEIEMLQWSDGGYSLPVKAIAQLFGFSGQYDSNTKLMKLINPQSQQTFQLDVNLGSVTEENSKIESRKVLFGIENPFKYPAQETQDGFLIEDDVFVEQGVIEKLFKLKISIFEEEASLTIASDQEVPSGTLVGEVKEWEAGTFVIENPEPMNQLVEKISLSMNSSTNIQETEGLNVLPGTPTILRDRIMANGITAGVGGTIFGKSYFVRPSIIGFNNRVNIQDVDWGILSEHKYGDLKLGSQNVGLSSMVSPSLEIWGLVFANKPAQVPGKIVYNLEEDPFRKTALTEKETLGKTIASAESERASSGFTMSATGEPDLPDNVVPENVANAQPPPDPLNGKITHHQTITFRDILPQHRWGYSAFLGRTPPQFHPISLEGKVPLFASQSEKWLAGGKLYYGLKERLTVGVSTASDHIFGSPRTFFQFANPLFADLQGVSSYFRDPNYFKGSTVGLSARYQLKESILLKADSAASLMTHLPGSFLKLPQNTNWGWGASVGGEYRSPMFSVSTDAYEYSPYFYTPSTIFSDRRYDRRGFGMAVDGAFTKFTRLSYNLRGDIFQTNLGGLIPGGRILAGQVSGGLNQPLGKTANASLNFNYSRGRNEEQERVQYFVGLNFRKELPYDIIGNVQLSRDFTNLLAFPTQDNRIVVAKNEFVNNIVDTSLDIPVYKYGLEKLAVGHRFSTFVDYAYLQPHLLYKNIFLEPLFQKSYGKGNPQILNRYGLRVGYRFKDGAQISMAYYLNKNTFQLDGVTNTLNTGHQFFFDFSELLGIMGNKAQFLGPGGEGNPALMVETYVDANQNGKMDAGEVPVPGISMQVDDGDVLKTDDSGKLILPNIGEGKHKLDLIGDELPISLSSPYQHFVVKMKRVKNQKVQIALIHQGGIITGKIALKNIKGKTLNGEKIQMVLKNEQGKVISYTTSDKAGNYRIANIPPGKYYLDLEPTVKASGKYKLLTDPQLIEFKAPENFDMFDERRGLDFEVLAL